MPHNFKPKKDIRQLYLKTINKISDNNVCIEVNSAGLRKPVKEIYPDKIFLKLCHKNKISITIGNDAHDPKLIESNLIQSMSYVKKIGYNKITIFNNRERDFIKI